MDSSRRYRGMAAARKSKRQVLAAAAWRVFLREGLSGTTARAIAQETGGSVGALYSYFPGINGVLQELALGSVADLTQKLVKSVGFERSGRARAELAIAEILEIYGPGTRGAELLPVIFGTGQKDDDGEFAARLNGKLIFALKPVAEGFQAVGMEPSRAQAKALSLACFVFGLVMFHSTGRMAAMEIRAKNVSDAFLSDCFPP